MIGLYLLFLSHTTYAPTFVAVWNDRCIVRPLAQGSGSVKVCPGGAL